MKKKWVPKLRHPWAQSAAGFTLVELVVVIAIMGILAGVGTVGYSGYMKSAQKKTDMTTVSNIVRAIEVASKSHVFQIDPVLQMDESNLQIPVGFIVLTNDTTAGIAAIQSNTGTTNTSASQACVIEKTTPKKLYRVESDGDVTVEENGCDKNKPVNKFVEVEEVIDYCVTHSRFIEETITTANGDRTGTSTDTKPLAGRGNVAYEGTVHVHGQVPSQEIYDYPENTEFTPATAGTLHDILVAAYGPNYASDVRLTSPDWTPSSLTSFYSGTGDLWENVQFMSDSLFNMVGTGTDMNVDLGFFSKDIPMIKDRHESSADLVYDVSKVITNMPEETFIGNWNAAPGAPLRNGFGFDGREYYTSIRIAYNHGFATYVRSQGSSPSGIEGTHDYNAHANAISAYAEPATAIMREGLSAYIPESTLNNIPDSTLREFLASTTDGGENLNLPMSICNSAFTDPNSVLDEDVKACSVCQALYTQYSVDDGPGEANGRAFYATMKQAAKTDAGIINDQAGVSFFDYYSGYLKEFQGLYDAVNQHTVGKSAIVIGVTYRGGELEYEVAPLEAHARDDS